MNDLFGPESRRDLLRRGFSRRDFGRLAALLTAGAALPFYNESALAQGLSATPNLPPDAVKINANENPMGPCPEAAEAIHKVVSQGGRYLYNETFAFVAAMAEVDGVSRDHVMPFAGSSDPLHRAVLAFTGPDKSYVVADPGYEAGARARPFHRCQDDRGAAPQGLRPRRPRDGPGRSQCRLDLRLQPQQPHRVDHPQGRHRVPGRPQAEGRDRAAGRGLHPPVEDGRAGVGRWWRPTRT